MLDSRLTDDTLHALGCVCADAARYTPTPGMVLRPRDQSNATRAVVLRDVCGKTIAFFKFSESTKAIDLDEWIPDLADHGTCGILLDLIASTSPCKSMRDTLHAVAHDMGRGLPYQEAIVHQLLLAP